MSTPTDAKTRKALPLFSGVLQYFPDALLAVAEVSRVGNDQHNPGQPLHWAKEKSRDELDALSRHLIDAGTMDSDGVRHSAKVAWRALANLQREIDRENGYDYDPATDTWRKGPTEPRRYFPQIVKPAPIPAGIPGDGVKELRALAEAQASRNLGRVETLRDGTPVVIGASRMEKGYDDQVREAEARRREKFGKLDAATPEGDESFWDGVDIGEGIVPA